MHGGEQSFWILVVSPEVVDAGPCGPCRNLEWGQSIQKERVQDQKGGGKRQRHHRTVCDRRRFQ